MKEIPLDDTMLDPDDCNCEFTPYEDSSEESWHYLRICNNCKKTWYSLHCPHDGNQSFCPECGTRATQAGGKE